MNYTSTSRLVQKLVDDEIRFAVISGCRPGADSTRNLHKDIIALGFKYNRFIGRWVEDGEQKDEYSVLIPDISLKKALIIGSEYERSSIIYKDKNGCKMYCTTPVDSYNVGDVIMTFELDKENPLNAQIVAKIFSDKKQGTDYSKIAESFELTERVLINTHLGFMEEKVDLTKLVKTLKGDVN